MCEIKSNTSILDTLETSVHKLDRSTSEPLTRIHNRRSRKALSIRMAKALCGLSDLFIQDLKAYKRMHECNGHLWQEGSKFTTYYCKHRACPLCSAMRSAKMIEAYEPQLTQIKDAYFVTLTDVNVKADDLRNEAKRFSQNWSKIRRNIHTHNKRNPHKSYDLRGIRTIECTYNWKEDTYNFHNHIIVSSKETAERIVKLHLKYHPTANESAQDIRKADEGAIKELFKYIAKGMTKDSYSAQIQHNIHSALKGMNQYYPFGISKQVSEDIDELQSEVIELNNREYGVWKFDASASMYGDWIEADGTPLLGEWRTDKKSRKFQRMIKLVDNEINHEQSDEIKRKTSETISDEDLRILRSNIRFCIDNGIELF